MTPIRLKRLRKPPVDPSRALTSDLAVPCPADQKFLPFQIAGIEYIATHSGTLLADDPGSGKTIQSVGLCNYYDDARRVLIVCPGFLKPHWRNEFKKWDVKGLTIGIVEGRRGEFPDTDVAIINYEILKDHRAALRAKKWDVVIVDEVHKLKNRRADRTREVLGGIKRDENKKIVEKVSSIPSRKLVLLTGTPTLNGKPKELWNIIQALDPNGLGADWYGFAKRYCKLLEIRGFDAAKGEEVHRGWIWDEADNLEELQEYMRSKFMVRRLKADILPQLPPKRRMIVPITGRNATVKKAIARQMVEFDRLVAGKNEEDFLTADFQDFSGAMKKLGMEMVEPTVEVVESDLEEHDKIVVMCYHQEVAESIWEKLNETIGIEGSKDRGLASVLSSLEPRGEHSMDVSVPLRTKEGDIDAQSSGQQDKKMPSMRQSVSDTLCVASPRISVVGTGEAKSEKSKPSVHSEVHGHKGAREVPDSGNTPVSLEGETRSEFPINRQEKSSAGIHEEKLLGNKLQGKQTETGHDSRRFKKGFNESGSAVIVTGAIPSEDRQKAVDRFQTDPTCHVFIGTIGSCGIGFTLTAADLMVFAERAWVPGDVTQAEDRIHRIGQALKVLYKHLVLEGSLAERQVATLIRKQNKSDLMLDTRAPA